MNRWTKTDGGPFFHSHLPLCIHHHVHPHAHAHTHHARGHHVMPSRPSDVPQQGRAHSRGPQTSPLPEHPWRGRTMRVLVSVRLRRQWQWSKPQVPNYARPPMDEGVSYPFSHATSTKVNFAPTTSPLPVNESH